MIKWILYRKAQRATYPPRGKKVVFASKNGYGTWSYELGTFLGVYKKSIIDFGTYYYDINNRKFWWSELNDPETKGENND